MILFKSIDFNTINVLFMSTCFMILFTADTTIVNIEYAFQARRARRQLDYRTELLQSLEVPYRDSRSENWLHMLETCTRKTKTIISSIHDENEEFQVEGYYLLALGYITFGISLWLGPSAVSVIGLRTSMVVAAALYTTSVMSFALENEWILYSTTGIGGVGAGLLWTAEGKYLILNSMFELVSRNIGIFWTLYCSSAFFGNLYTFYHLRGKMYIDRESRHWTIYGLSLVSAFATVLFAFLRLPEKKNNKTNENEVEKSNQNEKEKSNPLSELQKTWKVFTTKEMLILCLTFAFTGLQQAFGGGVYSASIGFTLDFGNKAKELIPLSGLFIGVGELLGGSCQILQGQYLTKFKWNRRVIITIGVISQILSFSLIYINIPAMAVFANTTDKAIINSNIYIALLCSILLGFGDGCLNTQNFSIIALLFPNATAQSCALYKFMKAMFVAVGYSLSSHLNLHYQLKLLTVTGIIGLISFIYVDVLYFEKSQRKTKQDEAVTRQC